MTFLRRRAVLAGLLALWPGSAAAALKPPLKTRPERVKPLGTFGTLDARRETNRSTTITVALGFRPAIDVETPVMRWWVPRWNVPAAGALRRACVPTDLSNSTVLESMVAGVVQPFSIDIPVPTPPKPANVNKGETRSERTKARQPNPRKRVYRAFVEIGDPVSCRRATFGFDITVTDDYPA